MVLQACRDANARQAAGEDQSPELLSEWAAAKLYWAVVLAVYLAAESRRRSDGRSTAEQYGQVNIVRAVCVRLGQH